MVPIAFLLGGAELGGWLATFFGVPDWLGAIALGVAGFFVSRAILRRALAPKHP